MTCRIAFRTDSSFTLGTGHLFRCLTLADALRQRGASVFFICVELPGSLIKLIENKGYVVEHLPSQMAGDKGISSSLHPHWSGIDWKIDVKNTLEVLAGMPKLAWLVVDHYALDKRWEGQIRPFTGKIMVIDDLADRPHDCDLLLDQTFHEDPRPRYAGLVPDHCRCILGPRYALLRPEFIQARKLLRDRDGKVRRILVFFGGSDSTNETEKGLEALRMLDRPDIAADVVVGAANPHQERIRRLCSERGNTTFHHQVDNMAERISKADLAIGAPGTSTWERCYLGLPAVTLVIAENQIPIASQVSKAGAIMNLGWNSEVSAKVLADSINRVLDAPAFLKEIGRKGMELMGGGSFEGVDGVVREIIGGRHVGA